MFWDFFSASCSGMNKKYSWMIIFHKGFQARFAPRVYWKLSGVKSKRENLWLIFSCELAFLLFNHYFLGHLMPKAFVFLDPSALIIVFLQLESHLKRPQILLKHSHISLTEFFSQFKAQIELSTLSTILVLVLVVTPGTPGLSDIRSFPFSISLPLPFYNSIFSHILGTTAKQRQPAWPQRPGLKL